MKAFPISEPTAKTLRALNYAPELEKLRRAGPGTAVPLKSLLVGMGEAFGTVFTRRDCSPEYGVPLLSQTDMFAAEPLGRTIRRDSMPNPPLHRVKKWQVLIAAAGQMDEGNLFGQSIIADARLEEGYVGPDAVALTFAEPGSVLNLWTYAYLNTSLGSSAMRTAAFGTSIPRLRLDILGDLPVPVAPKRTMERVATLVRQSVSGREAYFRSIRAARSVIEQLPEMLEAREMCVERKVRTLRWDGKFPTLCAWNFASSGGALPYLKKKWAGELGDVVESSGIFRGGRFARVPCKESFGVDFMSQRDVMMIRPSPRRIRHPGLAERLLFSRDGTILVGGQGTLGEGEIFGRAAFVYGQLSQAAITEHLLRIIPERGQEHALFAYLTTTVGFRLLRSAAVGTKLLSLREDMLRTLPVPEWPSGTKRRVSAFVKDAYVARKDADESESEAIRIIEEEVLPQWLA